MEADSTLMLSIIRHGCGGVTVGGGVRSVSDVPDLAVRGLGLEGVAEAPVVMLGSECFLKTFNGASATLGEA